MCFKAILLLILAGASTGTIMSSSGPDVQEAEHLDHRPVDEQFQCTNGKFIHDKERCNGEDDCWDRSDEINCPSCKGGSFQCGDRECIEKGSVCDLFDDCEDRSDENNCTSHICGMDEFRCNSGQCAHKTVRCNGFETCADKSDEENCLECDETDDLWFGKPNLFKCQSSNMCIIREKLCNSIKDCPDGSDEDSSTCQNLECTKDEFQCATGHCISEQERCDSYDSCGDNSEEINCTTCDSHLFKCETENKCIEKYHLCDEEPDCEDGSDESESACQNVTCHSHTFQCQSGQCVMPDIGLETLQTLRCNGVTDCNDESDEANCTSCSTEAYECGTGTGECIPKTALCNSRRECSDGADENEINCPYGSTPQVWTTNEFWSLSPNRSLTLQYLTKDVAVYFDSSVSPSVTWPFSPISQAWKYGKETYGSGTLTASDDENQRLYVFIGKLKVEPNDRPFTWSYREWGSGYRNVLQVGLRQRNGWGTGTDDENGDNYKKIISGLGEIVKTAAEGSLSNADFKICDSMLAVGDIVFYDIYIYLKGQRSADVMRWRAKQSNETLGVGKINCFSDWMLPIYENYGGSVVLKRYFDIFKVNWPKRKGAHADSRYNKRQMNVGEFVHFWSGAAQADLRFLVKPTFKWDPVLLMKLFAKAQIDFPNISYTETEINRGGAFTGILLFVLVALLMAVGLKLSWPFIRNKYSVLVNQYW